MSSKVILAKSSRHVIRARAPGGLPGERENIIPSCHLILSCFAMGRGNHNSREFVLSLRSCGVVGDSVVNHRRGSIGRRASEQVVLVSSLDK